MILQALVQYYERLAEQGKVSELGWCYAKVSHAIEITEDGSIKGIITLKQEEERGKKKVWVPSLLCVPEMITRSSGVKANFLCDNAKYFLGIDADGVNARTIECFQSARKKHLRVLKNAEGIMAKAICQYFKTWDPEKACENRLVKEYWDELNEGGNLIFVMKNDYAQEEEEIRRLWEEYLRQTADGLSGRCLVTGREEEIARIHRGIKGVPGAQSSGAALVSFNAPAFESYGKEQSYNAPVGKYAEFAYTTALNYLLSQNDFRSSLGDSMVVFWAESGKKEYQEIFSFCLDPKPDNQKAMESVFHNLERGLPVYLDDIKLDMDQNFYILCLAPNAARLAVRFFYQNSFGNILKNLASHYQRMEIVKPAWADDGAIDEYLGVDKMLTETVNRKSKDKSPVSHMSAMVLRAILEDARYPESLFSNVFIRIRAEQGKVTYGRAAIIKAVLIKNYKWEEGVEYMGLNEACEDPAYVLGRIFAVLEFIQKAANPGINATIRDRYFNSACTKPAVVFPVLFKLKNGHIRKLEREAIGTKVYYEKLLTELMWKIQMTIEKQGLPNQLSLEEQGRFMLGYYHQVQKNYEKREDK